MPPRARKGTADTGVVSVINGDRFETDRGAVVQSVLRHGWCFTAHDYDCPVVVLFSSHGYYSRCACPCHGPICPADPFAVVRPNPPTPTSD